jgi:hypothetical protein
MRHVERRHDHARRSRPARCHVGRDQGDHGGCCGLAQHGVHPRCDRAGSRLPARPKEGDLAVDVMSVQDPISGLAVRDRAVQPVPPGAVRSELRLGRQGREGREPRPPAWLMNLGRGFGSGHGANVTVGPFASTRRYMLACSTGSLTYSSAPSSSGGAALPSGVVIAESASDTVVTNDLKNTDYAPNATPIATGAGLLTVDPYVRYYAVTSGGTGGTEFIELPDVSVDENGNNFAMAGARIVFYLVALTDPADVVQFNRAFRFVGSWQQTSHDKAASPTLDSVGTGVCLVWCGFRWLFDRFITSSSDNSPIVEYQPVVLDASQGLKLTSLPTADPLVVNEIWNNGGVLTVSAG